MELNGEAHPRMNLLLLTPTYLLVVDKPAGDEDRRFDWIYHHRGQSASS